MGIHLDLYEVDQQTPKETPMTTTSDQPQDDDIDTKIFANATTKRRFTEILTVIATRVATLQSMVDKLPAAPTRRASSPGMGDADRTKYAEIRLHNDRLMEAGLQMKRLVRRYERETYKGPPLTKPFEVVLDYAVKKRLVKEYVCQPSQDVTEERYARVHAEIKALPHDLVMSWVRQNKVLQPGLELEEAVARHALTGFMGEKEHKAAERAFAKRFGHAP
jgi:hypothetical protein